MAPAGWSTVPSRASRKSPNTNGRTIDSQEGVAKLEPERLDKLTPGVVVPYLPGDIHSTNAVEGPGVVFRFLSYDLDKIDRYRYNLEKQTITKV